MEISVIGTGHVGLVTGACFAEKGHKVICVDNNAEKIAVLKSGGIPFYEPGLKELVAKNTSVGRLRFSTDVVDGVMNSVAIFIAVGTPPTVDGAPDLSHLENVSRHIARCMSDYRVIVEKSTVPVKTSERVRMTIEKNIKRGIEFDVASNPEFLREGNAIEDALSPDRIVIGVSSERARRVMEEIYAPFDAPLIFTDINSAELIKHASNSFLALKISFINAVARVCELSGANVEEVARGMGMDRRIGPHFLKAGLGYGGSCFPKDIEAFISISKFLGYDFDLLKEVQKINQMMRELFVKKIEDELWVLKDKRIGVLGLSFKPETDDMRGAPAIDVIKALQSKGALIKAYDPKAMDNARKILKDVEFCKDPYSVAEGSDLLAICTEWDEFRQLDLERVKSLMNYPAIVDGRNMFDPLVMKEMGFSYRSVGR